MRNRQLINNCRDGFRGSIIGFTLVELLVVISVIGVLSGFIIVGYSNWSKSLIVTQLKSDLSGAAAAMENTRNFQNYYPTSIPESTFKPSQDVDISVSSDGEVYCIGAISLKDSSLNFFIMNGDNSPRAGKCYKMMSKIVNGDSSSSPCTVSLDNQIYCWGSNNAGQLGDGTQVSQNTPVKVNTGGVLKDKIIKSISGTDTICAIAYDNTLGDQAYCWGANRNGKIGNGLTSPSFYTSPVAVSLIPGLTIKSISSGLYNTCAVASDNKAYCWGGNFLGQLGDGTTVDKATPTAVYAGVGGALYGKSVSQISLDATAGGYACAIDTEGKIYCWGDESEYGHIVSSLVPILKNDGGDLGTKPVKSISGSWRNSCVVSTDGKAYCWGVNFFGEHGNGTTNESLLAPVAVDMSGVLSGKTILSISSGVNHTCAVASDNKAYCWGWNNNGQLGDGTKDGRLSPVAVDVSGALSGKSIKAIYAGYVSTCAIASDRQTYCWGSNTSGQLGDGTNTERLVPTLVSPVY